MHTALMVSLRSRWRRALITCDTGLRSRRAALARRTLRALIRARMRSPSALLPRSGRSADHRRSGWKNRSIQPRPTGPGRACRPCWPAPATARPPRAKRRAQAVERIAHEGLDKAAEVTQVPAGDGPQAGGTRGCVRLVRRIGRSGLHLWRKGKPGGEIQGKVHRFASGKKGAGSVRRRRGHRK